MRILGIDYGSTSIKAVELDSAFGKYEIHDYYEMRLLPDDDPAQITARLIGGMAREPDKIVAVLPSSRVTFRNIRVPTKDRKAVQAAVAFELEDELPFDVEDAVHAHSILSHGGAGGPGAHVHIAATLKKHMAESLARFNEAGIDPDVITTETWAYRAFMNRAFERPLQAHPLLLIRIGAARTTLYVHHNGAPVIARDIPWGGDDLTQAIMDKYGISREEAEKAKLDNGFVLPRSQHKEATGEQVEFSEVIHGALARLLSEIRQTDLTCKHLTHEHVKSIHLAGGTAMLPGLRQTLEEDVAITTADIKSLSSLSQSGVSYSEQTDATMLLAAAAALCLTGPERSQVLNLRKGEFTKAGSATGFSLANFKAPLISAGIVTASLILSLAVQSQVFESRIESMDSRLERAMRSFFGSLSRSARRTYLRSPSKLRSAVEEDLGTQRELAELGSPNPVSPLDFLRKLSATVPKSITTDMVDFEVGLPDDAPYDPAGSGKARVTFIVKDRKSIDQLTTSMKTLLNGVTPPRPQQVDSPHGDGKSWKVAYTGTPKREAYGD